MVTSSPSRTSDTEARDEQTGAASQAPSGERVPAIVSRAMLAGPVVLVLLAVAGLAVALLIGGGAKALPVADPGPAVMIGVPVARTLWNITAAVTIGALVFAAWVLPRQSRAFELAMNLAAGSAAAWVIVTAIAFLLTFLQITNIPLSADEQFGRQLWFFITEIEMGLNWMMALGMVVLLSTFAAAARSKWGVGLTTIWALLCLWPLAAQGHAAGAANHETAVGSLTLHYTGAAVWLGGLIVFCVLARFMSEAERLNSIERYSTLALLSFIVVFASGEISAWLNVGGPEGYATGYGVILMLKTVCILILGVFGAIQRRRVIDRMRADAAAGGSITRRMMTLVVAELAIMGFVAGLAGALGRTPTPVPQLTADEIANPTPAQILTGEMHPPEFTFTRLFTEWRFDPVWTLVCLLGIFFYVAGVRRLAKRGDEWPLGRTISFVSGMVTLLWLVNGGLVVYGKFMFSFHMIQHMFLAMIIPIFLALSSPISLLLRAVKPRKDGSMGGREWALLAVHSKWGKFITHPIVASIMFAISMLVFYYTPLLRWAEVDHVGHMWMVADFLIVGYLFASSLVGADPVQRVQYPLRLISLVLVMTFHAFFGLSVMSGTSLLVADWFGAMGREWGPSAIEDQQIGGAWAWGLGEFPTVILAVIVAVQWSRKDSKAAKRRDERVDTHGDAELEAYNAQLRAMAAREAGDA